VIIFLEAIQEKHLVFRTVCIQSSGFTHRVHCGESETIVLSDVSLAVRVHPSLFTGPHTSLHLAAVRSEVIPIVSSLARRSTMTITQTNRPVERAVRRARSPSSADRLPRRRRRLILPMTLPFYSRTFSVRGR